MPPAIKRMATWTVSAPNHMKLKAAYQELMDDSTILSYLLNAQTAERGFSLLLDKYQQRLYWHIRRMVIHHEDANDVLQNCLIKVFRNIQKFEQKSKLYTWLYRIATNEAITFLNQKKRKIHTSLDEVESPMVHQLEADPYFEGSQAQLQLQKAIATLPDKQKLVFQMRYFEEMSYQDMSDILETSVGALKASYHHAVKKIEHFVRNVESF